MSRIRGFDTKVEVLFRRALNRHRVRFVANDMTLPGRPDLVFRRARLIVFIDGNFWHGYQFPRWKARLGPYWQEKIERNRRRDVRNHRKLRRTGWTVIRLWEHQIKADLDGCVERVLNAVRANAAVLMQDHPAASRRKLA
jgi:DNA mismatch endonuclease (patch repair protein)